MAAVLNTVVVSSAAEYSALRAASPDAIVPAVGEPWAPDGNEGGLKIYARDGMGRTGWYHQRGDMFVPD